MKRLLDLYKKKHRFVVGLMSGTSLDGIDVALVKIDGSGTLSQVKQIAFKTIYYTASNRQRILAACQRDTSDVERICSLNFDLGELFASAVIEVCRENSVALADLDLIGSHGQTIWHHPGNSTLQIGEAAVIAERTGIITVSDFRVRDVARGGQGAPLVPYTEHLLYHHPLKTRLLQNIGGIANVTLLPEGSNQESIIAFDTGPGNMMIDFAVDMLTNGRQKFDQDGEIASRGKVDTRMLAELMTHPYLSQPPPKTTGREVFGNQWTAKILTETQARGVSATDIIATLTCFTAKSIAESYRHFLFPQHKIDEVIIGGGGSHNQVLMNMLRSELSSMPVHTQEELGFSSDAKEAIAFAILANEAISGNANNLPAVTGARGPVIMGKISL